MTSAVVMLPLATTWQFYGGIGAVGVGLLVMLLLAVPHERRLTTEERVTQYAARAGSGATAVAPLSTQQSARPEEAALASAKAAAGNVLNRNKGLEHRIAQRLEGAGSQWRPAEWLLFHAAMFIGFSIVGLIIGGGNLVVGLVFMVLGALGPWMYLGFRRKRRKKKFESGLPDTLQLMSGSLAAGLSLAQSVDTIVREASEPIVEDAAQTDADVTRFERLRLSLGDCDRADRGDQCRCERIHRRQAPPGRGGARGDGGRARGLGHGRRRLRRRS